VEAQKTAASHPHRSPVFASASRGTFRTYGQPHVEALGCLLIGPMEAIDVTPVIDIKPVVKQSNGY